MANRSDSAKTLKNLSVEHELDNGDLVVEELYKTVLSNSGAWCIVMFIVKQTRRGAKRKDVVRAIFNRYRRKAGAWRRHGSITLTLDAVKKANAAVDEFIADLEKQSTAAED